MNASTAKTIYQHLSLCYLLFFAVFVISLFLTAVYKHYIAGLNRKSNDYKSVKRYIDLLALNLEAESLKMPA